MTTHRQQTFLGYLFLAIGVALIALAIVPTVLGLRAHPTVHVDVPLVLLGIGIGVAVGGAWLIPNSGAGPVVTQVVAVVGPYLPRIPGLSRVGDPPAPPPATPPAPPPKDSDP